MQMQHFEEFPPQLPFVLMDRCSRLPFVLMDRCSKVGKFFLCFCDLCACAKSHNTFRMRVGLYQKIVTVWFLLLLSQTTIFWMYVCRSKLSVLARGCGLGKVFGYLWNTFRFNIQSCSHSRRHNHGHSHCCRKHVCWEFETPLNLRENTNVLSARQVTPHIIIIFVSCRSYASAQSILNYLFWLIQSIW